MYKSNHSPRAWARSHWQSIPRRLLARLRGELRVRWTALRGGRAAQSAQTSIPRLKRTELRALLDAAALAGGTFGPVDETLIETAASARGIRLAELLALRWGDVDWLAGTVRIERALRGGSAVAPKCGGAREVRLSPHAQATLRRYRTSMPKRSPGNLVFGDPRSTSHLDQKALRRRLRIALERANLPKLAFAHLASSFRMPWWSRYL